MTRRPQINLDFDRPRGDPNRDRFDDFVLGFWAVVAAIAVAALCVAATPKAQPPAATPAPLRVYSWGDYGVGGVTPFVWADFFDGDAQAVAAKAAPLLKARAAGGRVLFLRHVGEGSDGPFAKGVADAWINGPDAEPTRRWCRAFFSGLKERGVESLDYLVLDYEGGAGYWNLGDDRQRRATFDALKARPDLARLPESARRMSYAQFAATDRQAVGDFNRRGEELVRQFLARGVAEPLAEFYPGTPTSNYGAAATAAPTTDANGWVAAPHPLIYGTHSSPPLYGVPGNRAKYDAGVAGEAALKLAWLDDRQTLRACLAAGKPVAPWYAPPRFTAGWEGNADAEAARERWAEAARCDVNAGARVLLLWGDAGTDATDRWSDADAEFLRGLMPELRALATAGPVAAADVREAK